MLTAPSQPVRPTSTSPARGDWQAELRAAIRDAGELCRLLGLPRELAGPAGDFPLLVPRGFVARMRPGDPRDPLLRQVLPVADEQQPVAGFSPDPVGDQQAAHGPGLLQKYHGRVLLVLTGACAVNCRYCFRRHYPYATGSAGPRQWRSAVEQIAADATVSEVILSGGDPLLLADPPLADLARQIELIPHVRRLRIHTRLPIVLPERVTDPLCRLLRDTRLTTVVVLHANHANELDGTVARAAGHLAATRTLLLNQAVLLRGVNDTVEAQQALAERLVEIGVQPYYLHQVDRVAGAAHFEVPVAEGRELVHQLRTRLPGYAVPQYVQEIAGEPNKVVLA